MSDQGAFAAIRENVDMVAALDDAVMIIVAGSTGAVAGRVFEGGTTTLEVVAFMVPTMLGLWVVIGLFKAVVRMNEDE